MKFIVTGGAGFIGSHIVMQLLDQGHDVVIIDNHSRGRVENLKNYDQRFDFINMDIINIEKSKKIMSDVDGIFHQAALTSVPESFIQREKYHTVNVIGTEHIFKIAKEFGIKVVYASSSSVYGDTVSIPIKEDSEKNPINPYGITKLECEKLAQKYHDLGVSIIGLRYFNVYGVGQTDDYSGVITKFHNRIIQDKSPIIFGDGAQTRDFVSVNDVAKANLLSMKSKTDFAFINIGTGISTSVKELASMMVKLSGKSLTIEFEKPIKGDIKDSQADVSFAKKAIDWTFETGLYEGLRGFFS